MIAEIIVAGGCFWGIQAAFERIKGVLETEAGYTGGHIKNPTYKDVCSGKTGHAESVLIRYDTDQITLDEILDLFFMIHNPTTLNRQGPDFGTQYRSAIFYQTPNEQSQIKSKMREVQKYFSDSLLTQVRKRTTFWPAEPHHQHYLARQGKSSCRQTETNKEHFLQRKLSPEQYWIMRGKGTEAPFSGDYIYTEDNGTYCCAACSQHLFRSRHKFQSDCGWPAFEHAVAGSVIIRKDFSHFMMRDEVICSRCGSHLGHLFTDGPTATGLRYCINSAALILCPDASL